MALSDELKSLSEQVKKMTTTIAKLILARSPHGTSSTDENIFDKLSNGLPRNMKMEQIAEFALTSKVILSYKIEYLNSFHDQLMKGLWKRSSNGCIYPLDNSYEKILYVEINEDYKFDSEELLEELRNFSVTHQVFDEMSESVLSTNHGQTPLSEDNEEEIQQPNAYKMLDELPLPTFIKEMAEASKTTEVESLQGDYELEPAIQKVQGDHFTHKQLCAKLCALEGSHLRDLVIIIANRMRFSTILGSLLNGCQFSDLMPRKVDDSYGSSYLECPCSEVNAKSFVMLNADYSSKFIENVVSALLLRDIDWFIGSSISMILGVNVYNPKIVEIEHTERSRSNCGSGSVGATFVNDILIPIFQPDVDPCTTWISIPYDPGILVIDLSPLVFTFTLEDKGEFRADEGITKEQTWLLLNPLVWSNYNANRMRESAVFLTCVFDPGELWDALIHSSYCSNPNLGFYMSYLMVCVLDELGNCNTWLPLLSNMSCSRIITMINAFSPGHIRYDSSKLLITSHLLRFWYLTFDRGSCDHSKVLSAHVGVPSLIKAHIVSKSAAIIILTSVFIETGDKGILFSTPLKLILSFVFHNMSLSEGNITIAYYYEGWVVSDMYVDGSVRIVLLLNGSSFHLLKENLKVATKCFMKKEVVRLVTIFIFDPGISKPRLVEKRSVAVRCSAGVTINLVFVYAEILVWPKIYSLRQGYEAARWKLLGRVVFVIEKRAYAIEETREKNSARKDPTISSKFSMFMIINSLVFDPGGWKYNISLAESATSKFLQTTQIFLSCYLAQLDLLHSSNCADHEVAILVFDPGGYGNGQKVKKQPEACQYGGGKRLKDKRNEDHWIYVFDPGGY